MNAIRRLALIAALVAMVSGLAPRVWTGDVADAQRTTRSAAAITAATPVAQVTPTAVNGDGFWFSGGVQATLLNRVVRMAPDTPAAVRSLVAEVVRQVNTASGAGVAIGPDTTGPPTATEIVVRAPVETICGPNAAGCASNAVATVEGYGVVVNALVEIDRDLLGSGYELPILLHEMGHAMGLGHFDQPYDGQMQLMWNSVTSDMTSYRTGDRKGLAALGAVFTNRNVTGNIDRIDLVPGGLRLRGWVIDLDAPDLALGLTASLDGTQVTGVADAYRPDVAAVYPTAGPNHGVDVVVPTAAVDGGLTLCLVATGGRGQTVGIGCRAVAARHAPLGNLELMRTGGPGVVEASGWALDPDTAEAITVELTIDGSVVGTTTTDVLRSDVTRVYPGYPGPRGWAVSVSGVDAGSRQVCAVARDATGDPDQTLGCRTISVGGNPIGNVDAIAPGPANPLRVEGWALDPDATAPVDVHLYVDGRYRRSATADRTRLDVARVYPGYGTTHGFSVALPALPPGPHTACVFGINQLAGTQNTLLGCRGFTTAGAAPFGNVDVVATVDNRLSMVGWAIDPDTVDPIAVHLWADGRYLAAGTANRLRSDVGRVHPAFGSNHGFAIPVDRLDPGTHQVCAYGINAGTLGPNPLLGCRTVRIG